MAIPIGLDANKSLMDMKFSELTIPKTGKMYDAAYQAYFNLANTSLNDSDANQVDSTEADLSLIVETSKAQAKLKIEQDATKFATDFCKGIDEVLKEISKQIDAHVKALQINVNTPTPGPSGTVLTSPLGPCTGTIILSNVTPTGGITTA